MSDLEEKEICFEEIGLSEQNIKLDNIKKIVNINLKIKRLPRQKNDFKGNKIISKSENNSNKPLNSARHDLDPAASPRERKKLKLVPTLCNGASCPTTDEIMTAIEELRDLVKKNCNETRQIRQDILGIKEAMVNDNPSYIPFMRGPCQTLDDLNLLEYRVLEDDISRKALETVLGKISDASLEKYIRSCLRAIISDKVAVNCTWLGKKKDGVAVSVQDMTITRIVCDCTRKKFPSASTSFIAAIIKSWFKHARERWRKSDEAKKLKSEADEALKNLT